METDTQAKNHEPVWDRLEKMSPEQRARFHAHGKWFWDKLWDVVQEQKKKREK